MPDPRLLAAAALIALLGLAAWRINDRAWDRGYAASEARYTAQALRAAREAQDWLQRAATRQQSAREDQAAADAAFARQQADIHAQEGGDAPLSPYLRHAFERLFGQ